MFHRFGGKAFFYVVALFFLLVSLQNTWQFLITILPDATPAFLAGMMIVFEGGFMGWLALFMHGSENIPRTIIAGLMLLITGIGVGTAAYFELDGQMHKSIAVKIDPGFLANVPTIVNGVYIATGVAIVLYILSNPCFFHRMKHLNEHGAAPQRIPREVTGHLVSMQQTDELPAQQKAIAQPASQQPLALPQPQSAQDSWWDRRPRILGGKGKQEPLPVYTTTQWPQEYVDEQIRRYLDERTAEKEARANVQSLNLPDPEQFAQDLVDSVGGGSASPLPQAPSPNGAKPSK